MKFLLKIIGALITVYLSCWVGLAVYFGYAERHKGLLEDNLSTVFGRQVTIEALQTTWVGWQPGVHIDGLKVASDHSDEPALAFENASMILSPLSVLTFWPRFTEFVVEKPSLEIVTPDNGAVQIAGISLNNRRVGFNREKLISWLLNHSNVAWHQGQIRWHKSDATVARYTDISFVYQRDQESRNARATISSVKGQVSAIVAADGNLLSSEDWDASIEVTGVTDQERIQPGDVSFKVENGQGQIQLAQLDVERIRDLLSLSGLADKARWILDAELSGRLHDVNFDFSGTLTELSNWSLRASASDVDFKSLDSLPALNNLNGELNANARKGSFNFTAFNSTFEWNKLYRRAFPIKSADGRFTWQRNAQGAFEVALHQGRIEDPNLEIYDINVDLTFAPKNRSVSTFGDLFKVESLDSLSYEGDGIVVGSKTRSPEPLYLDASAKFSVENMRALSAYLPTVDKLRPFRRWLSTAYKAGQLSNGRMSFRGELAPKALAQGKAKLEVAADFDSVTIDYAPAQDWPPATDGNGRFTIENDFLTVMPTSLKLNGDPVTNGELTIENLYSKEATLKLNGKTSTSLQKGMAFIFQGPLIKPESRPDVLPVRPTAGRVNIDVDLVLPLTNLKEARVRGQSTVIDGAVMLPENVPLRAINGVVDFTERRVSSNNIQAQFLGGLAQAKLITTAEAQPPKMRLIGSGTADLDTLTPWVGEHLLTWFSGQSKWQGSLDIDGENLLIKGHSDLVGVEVTAPAPLSKAAEQDSQFSLHFDLGGRTLDGVEKRPNLRVDYANLMRARFQSRQPESGFNTTELNADISPSLFDKGRVQVGRRDDRPLQDGLHFEIDYPTLDLDELLESVIDLASYETSSTVSDTAFLDAIRSVTIRTPNAVSMSRPFGAFLAEIVTPDGWEWGGQLSGDNIEGRVKMLPRADVGSYTFDLEKLVVGPQPGPRPPVLPIDSSLLPAEYPALNVTIDQLRMDGKSLGALDFVGRPSTDSWNIEKFALVHNGIRTNAAGSWRNTAQTGSLSSFDFSTTIDEAEGVLTDMDFDGYIRKGRGSMGGTVKWAGAPHEFDYSRLNGKFDLFMKDGELVQVEPGSGKLLGLLNFNAIARRLVFDFRDVFASGLQFDRMRYRGIFSDGEAILQDAFILTPAVFVRMEGKVNLDRELIDMDVHISPELGGNLTLLSALANPTAGAVVFITSQLFKDDMRRASFKSFQAKGTWEDFEMVEIDFEGNPLVAKAGATESKQGADSAPATDAEAEQKAPDDDLGIAPAEGNEAEAADKEREQVPDTIDDEALSQGDD